MTNALLEIEREENKIKDLLIELKSLIEDEKYGYWVVKLQRKQQIVREILKRVCEQEGVDIPFFGVAI